jgi:hypothetical protein
MKKFDCPECSAKDSVRVFVAVPIGIRSSGAAEIGSWLPMPVEANNGRQEA